MFEEQLKFAAAALASGKPAICEIVSREILDQDPRNVAALNFLGVIAAQVGEVDYSARCFEAALKVEPGNETVRANLAMVKSIPKRNAQAQGTRYLVIKSWGFGFWSDVSQVLGSLLLAEVTGRTPVVHWGTNSLFGDGSGGDAFRHYFEPVSDVGLADLAGVEHATFFPQKWSRANLTSEDLAKWQGEGSRSAAIHFLNKKEVIAVNDFYVGVVDVAPWLPVSHPMYGKPVDRIYRHLVEKYLRPARATQQSCESFLRAHLNAGPFLAVHMRGSDKLLEDQNLNATNQTYFAKIQEIDPTWPIFLLTDDEQIRARMISMYGDRVITTDCQRTNTSTGVHYLPNVKRVQAGMEIMLDTYLALHAARFFGNGRSTVSAMIDVLRDWNPGDSVLEGQSLLMQRNLFLHLRN